jgi:hypothetical protein
MSTLKTSNFQSLTAGTTPVFKDLNGTEIGQLCRAWVNFNGTTASPSTIRGSFNVSSVTKNGTGDYTVNFTTAMPDANYCVNSIVGDYTTNNGNRSISISSVAAPTTSAVRIANQSNGGAEDQLRVMVTVFR